MQGGGLYWTMIRNHLMVLAHLLGGHADMRSLLARGLLAQPAQCLNQVRTRNIARKLHRASTSSRTK
jgi:hypothetical protein